MAAVIAELGQPDLVGDSSRYKNLILLDDKVLRRDEYDKMLAYQVRHFFCPYNMGSRI